MKNPTYDETAAAVTTFLDTFGLTARDVKKDGIRFCDGQVVIETFAADQNGKRFWIGDRAYTQVWRFPYDKSCANFDAGG